MATRTNINASTIGTIGEGGLPPVTPAVNDLMSAFRSGFITVNDLAVRGSQLPSQIAGAQNKLQEELNVVPLQRQAAIGQLGAELQVQPLRTENILAAERLRAGQIQQATTALPTQAETEASSAERSQIAQFKNRVANPATRPQALAEASVQQTEDLYSTAFGVPPPETIQIPGGGVTPKPIEEYVLDTYGQDALAGDAQAVLNNPDIQREYAAYATEAQNRPLTLQKGTPEYNAELKRQLSEADLQSTIKTAQIKALPGIFEAQAKAAAEAPAKSQAAATDLQKQYAGRQEIQDLRKVQASYFKLNKVLDPNVESTPLRDQAAIFSWMKILDPGSTVREGEYATVEKARGVPDSIRAVYNRTVDGLILTPEQRNQLKEAVKPVYQGQVEAAAPTIRQFLRQEASLGAEIVPPEDAKEIAELTRSTAGVSVGIKPGDRVTLKDGRTIVVKEVTSTGIIPE